MEEIVGRCAIIEEETVSSIENWTDILPEADITTQVGMITELVGERESLADELLELNEQLVASTDENRTEVDGLKKEIREKENELKPPRQELAKKEADLGSWIVPDQSESVFSIIPSFSTQSTPLISSQVTSRSTTPGIKVS